MKNNIIILIIIFALPALIIKFSTIGGPVANSENQPTKIERINEIQNLQIEELKLTDTNFPNRSKKKSGISLSDYDCISGKISHSVIKGNTIYNYSGITDLDQ